MRRSIVTRAARHHRLIFREPEYAPPTSRPLHAGRARSSPLRLPMQVPRCKSLHHKLMRDNCGECAPPAHIIVRAKDGARPPLTLAFWPLPVCLSGLHMWEWNMGVVETAKWIVELVYGMGIYSGARGGFYETLTSARNSRLPATVPVVRRQRNAIGRARLPRITHPLLPSAQPLSPSQLL